MQTNKNKTAGAQLKRRTTSEKKRLHAILQSACVLEDGASAAPERCAGGNLAAPERCSRAPGSTNSGKQILAVITFDLCWAEIDQL